MLVISGGRVLDPASGHDAVADILIDKGRIQQIGPGAASGIGGNGVQVIEAKGRWVLPGLVDLHVHLRDPGQEYKEDIASGLQAAAAGGFTTVCAMPNTNPVNDNRAITETMLSRAASSGGSRLRVYGAITRGTKGEQLTEMGDLREAGAIGVSDDGRCLMNGAVMRRALEYARTFDLLVAQHCEDHHMTDGAQMNEGPVSTRLGLKGWPREAEDVIVARDLILAEMTGARYHVCHISSRGAVRLLREAKARGLKVSAEVTPHHLTLTDEALLTYDTHCKVNPPLRSEEDREAMRQALADGTIDCVATDHAPHSAMEKDCEFDVAAVGINGLETAVPLLLDLVRSQTLSPLRFAEVLSTAPARLLPDFDGGNLKPQAPADLTILDPELRWTVSEESLRSRSHNTPFLNRQVLGAVTATIVGGVVAYERHE